MEEGFGFVAILLSVLVAAAVSRRIQGTIITLPMVYTALGLLIGPQVLGLLNLEVDNEFIQIVAELSLVMVLATDASRIDLRQLVRDHTLPLRLLSIGLLLTMILGTLAALGLFREISLWEAAILAIVLAPTDASLGQAVVTSPWVPVRIRQTLNIESGLNDGIAMPFLLLAIALAAASEAFLGPLNWLAFAASEIVIGALAGVVKVFCDRRATTLA